MITLTDATDRLRYQSTSASRTDKTVSLDEVAGDLSIPELFARVAVARGDAVAISSADGNVTYCDLARRSDDIAGAIFQHLDRGQPVAVVTRDQTCMITGMLAVWKAGRLCVPVDTSLPRQRIEFILRDSGAGVILTDSTTGDLLTGASAANHLLIDDVQPSDLHGSFALLANTPATIIYTSGSTGTPKGVVRSHRAIVHRARATIGSLSVNALDRIAAIHSPASSAGLRDVVTALLSGATLVTFDLHRAGFSTFSQWIQEQRITILCSVASTLRQLLMSVEDDVRWPLLRCVRLGSEPLYRRDVEQLLRHVQQQCTIITAYGASEASGICEYRIEPGSKVPHGRMPAGHALEGINVTVEDEHHRALPPGEIGEVVVRSRYLATGYWNRPDMTRAVFGSDSQDPEIITYRTGDLGRLTSGGCLELLGRRDQQVKVRGYLVHPGEIELALVEHPHVRESVVVGSATDFGDTRLIAYVVPARESAFSSDLLRSYLRERLPSYMLPSVIITLDALPITLTGKVDRQALPRPPARNPSACPFVAPRSPTEHQIAQMWEELFNVSPVGAADDFFDLGGDSLLAAMLVAKIEVVCGRTISPAVLLKAPTVAALAIELVRVEDDFSELVSAIRVSGARAPVFFLHNDFGRGVYTVGIARALDSDRPFFALHLHGQRGLLIPCSTIEAIAADCIATMRNVRRRGPYVLAGHCNAGLIALEMAHQLRAVGEHVEVVVMVDTRAPCLPRALHFGVNALNSLVERGGNVIKHLHRTLRWRLAYYRSRASQFRRASLGYQVTWLTHKARSRWAHDSASPRGQRSKLDNPSAEVSLAQYRRAARRYVPPRYQGKVAIFRAEGIRTSTLDFGWSKFLSHVEVVLVPGDHHTCITRHVAVFAAKLSSLLSNVESRF